MIDDHFGMITTIDNFSTEQQKALDEILEKGKDITRNEMLDTLVKNNLSESLLHGYKQDKLVNEFLNINLP